MKEEIENIRNNAVKEIEIASDAKELELLRVKYLGKKGELTAILRGMGGLSPEERPIVGGLVNVVKAELEEMIGKKEIDFEKAELKRKLEEEDYIIDSFKTEII